MRARVLAADYSPIFAADFRYQLRRQGGGPGVAAMCAGGGMGAAIVIEVTAP